jgi:hypothetical protein
MSTRLSIRWFAADEPIALKARYSSWAARDLALLESIRRDVQAVGGRAARGVALSQAVAEGRCAREAAGAEELGHDTCPPKVRDILAQLHSRDLR